MTDDTSQDEIVGEDANTGTPKQEPQEDTQTQQSSEPKSVNELDLKTRYDGAVEKITVVNKEKKELREENAKLREQLQKAEAERQKASRLQEIEQATSFFVSDKMEEIGSDPELDAKLTKLRNDAVQYSLPKERLLEDLEKAYKLHKTEKGATSLAQSLVEGERKRQEASIAPAGQSKDDSIITLEELSKLPKEEYAQARQRIASGDLIVNN